MVSHLRIRANDSEYKEEVGRVKEIFINGKNYDEMMTKII